jgi:hypothetical protein
MARTMLDEYKTSDRFWAEAINTVCHATNRLYLHKLLKKTSYEPNDRGQEESNDQGGYEDDGDKGDAPPHPRVCQIVQRDHPVDNIFGDIKKGVVTRSRVANFCEHYSFVSSFEPFKVEDALRDPDWVVVMQEQLNNFKSNEVWSLVERPKQNFVGTKWVFRNNQDE